MNIQLKVPETIKIDNFEIQKMIFLYNALEDGWQIKKKNEQYILTKLHENKREVYLDSYLEEFLKTKLDVKR